MTITLPARYRALMPGTFDAEDFIDFYKSPFEILEELQTAYREKEAVPWSIQNLPEVDIGDVDWHKYAPPASLKRAPNITNQILLDIISSSIENVKARVAKEDLDKQKAKETLAEDGNDDSKPGNGKGKEPYLPVIVPVERHLINGTDDKEVVGERASTSLSDSTSIPSLEKTEKRRRFALRRLFQRNRESGESSTAGSARESLRQQYETHQENGNTDASKGGPDQMSLLSRINLWKNAPAEPVECVSCLDDFHPKEVVKVACHSYCRDCFVRLISASVQNEQQWPPKCCLNEIPFRTILRYIPSDLKKTFQDRSQEWGIPINERIYCSEADCSLWVKPRQIDHGKSQCKCDNGHLTCIICRGPHHSGADCPQDHDLDLTNRLAEEEGWKRCFNCNALVEHREACQHMTCRCGTEFCYVCSRVWRTCACTMEQLQDVKSGAATRRAERLRKEEDEATELRMILQQIEEFEREEVLKAELLRQEQVRLEEERRQAELEERVRQESIRRRDMETKHKELRLMLDQLHELQQVLLEIDQEKEPEELATKIKLEKEEFAKKQETERSDLQTLASTKMADKEYTLQKDYQIRAAEENDIEEAYHERLKEFWKEKKDGEEEVEKAMLALKKQMDKRQRAWQKWKSDELVAFQTQIEEERSYKEELMYSAEHRLNDTCDEKEKELQRRHVAEKMWLQVVIVEREKLLHELEIQDVEGDADSIFAVDHTTDPAVELE